MNVLFLTSTLPRFSGDQQASFVLEQASAWKQARPDDNLHILAPHDSSAAKSEQINAVNIRRFLYFWPMPWQNLAYPAIMPNLRNNPLRAIQIPFFLWCQYSAARRMVQTHKIDLIYAHWVMPQGIVARLIKQSTGVPYVLQNHSSDLAVFGKLGGVGRKIARRILHDAQGFFCVNTIQRDFAQDLLPGLQCHVLPMGVAMQVHQDEPPVTDSTKARYALGTISRLSRKKGLHHLIAAVELLASRGSIPHIAIAGDGEEADNLRSLPRAADVTFTGFLSGDEKQNFFRECYAMVFPSASSKDDVEGLPVALLEAMSAGKQVIASQDTNITLLAEWPDIAGIVEFLDDPSDTIAFADAIAHVLTLTPEQSARNAQVLKKVAERYRWEKLIEEYLMVIDAASR